MVTAISVISPLDRPAAWQAASIRARTAASRVAISSRRRATSPGGAGAPGGSVVTAPSCRQPDQAREPAGPAVAEPVAEAPASDGASGYVPAPVSFVSEDDDEYGSKPGYDPGRGPDAVQGGAAQGSGQGWRDSGRPGKQDKVFDVPAGRRSPVVFEEEDDLDVPDFLK